LAGNSLIQRSAQRFVRPVVERKRRPTASTTSKIGIASVTAFNANPAMANLPARVGVRLALRAASSPGIARAKMTNAKNGSAQMISLLPLPNGGISISDKPTKNSIPSARMPLPNEKYVKGCVRDYPTEAGSSLSAGRAGLEQNALFYSLHA
jgi:hypothetical protein